MLKKLSPPQIIVLSFISAIFLGTILLFLPISKEGPGHLSFLNALFTATSAVCVTGLIVVDTGSYFSTFGKIVILILIQLGGLGIMTFSTFFFAVIGKKISIKEQLLLTDVLGDSRKTSLIDLVKKILLLTFVFEFIGALVLYLKWIPKYGVVGAIPTAIFHSISAFCNAGFSIYSNSFEDYKGDVVIVGTIAILIIIGGLGFVVVNELSSIKRMFKEKKRFFIKLSLQTKLVLTMSGILILFPAIIFFILEANNVLSDLPWKEKIIVTLFQIITPRTAGFNVIPMSSLNNASLMLTKFMMFIGASPGSTGGGIKTTTFFILILLVIAMLKDRKNIVIFNKTIPGFITQRVVVIAFLSLIWLLLTTNLLLFTEQGLLDKISLEQGYFAAIIFEEVSAFGTVGLSTGITPYLSNTGKVIVSISMLLGRLGPLTMALAMTRKEQVLDIGFPEEKVMVG